MRRLLSVMLIVWPVAGMAGHPAKGACADLNVATPGLYGLCVAYCGAQGVGRASDSESLDILRTNYDRKRREGDPALPCLSDAPPAPPTGPVPPPSDASCPCWDTATLEAALPSPTECQVTDTSYFAREDGAGVSFAAVYVASGFLPQRCQIQDGISGSGYTLTKLSLSPTDLAGCQALWLYHAQLKGCYVPPAEGQ